jgi:hypothetical protein
MPTRPDNGGEAGLFRCCHKFAVWPPSRRSLCGYRQPAVSGAAMIAAWQAHSTCRRIAKLRVKRKEVTRRADFPSVSRPRSDMNAPGSCRAAPLGNHRIEPAEPMHTSHVESGGAALAIFLGRNDDR